MNSGIDEERMTASPIKEDLNYYPFVSIIEKASTDEYKYKASGTDTLKPLPPNPRLRSRVRRKGWIHFVGPDRSTSPSETTVSCHVAFLLIFVALLSLAARFPVNTGRIALVCISGFGLILLVGTFVLDLAIQGTSHETKPSFINRTLGNRPYRRNIGNTAMTVLLTIPFMTTLYCLIWFPSLNKTKLEMSSDTAISTV